MNFMGLGFNSKSKGYLTYDSVKFKTAGVRRESVALSVWKLMISRCYAEGSHTAYTDCSVSEDWLDFQNFAEFYYEDRFRQDGWTLDKDILIKGDRVYSKDGCCFVPNEINVSLAGYKGIGDRELPTGVSVHKKTGLYRARVNDTLTRKGLVKYFESVSEAEECYKVMKTEQLIKIAEHWKEQIDPKVYLALTQRVI